MPLGQQQPPAPGGSQRVFWYSDRPLPRTLSRWPGAVRGAHVVVIDGPGGSHCGPRSYRYLRSSCSQSPKGSKYKVRTPGPGWGSSSSGEPTLRAKAYGPNRTITANGDTARGFQRAHKVTKRMCSRVCTANRNKCRHGQVETQSRVPTPLRQAGQGHLCSACPNPSRRAIVRRCAPHRTKPRSVTA